MYFWEMKLKPRMKTPNFVMLFLVTCIVVTGCFLKSDKEPHDIDNVPTTNNLVKINDSLKTYAKVKLESDISELTDKEKAMLILFIQASKIMDDIFWEQAYGSKNDFIQKVPEALKSYALINYGPWDRLNSNKPFVEGFEEKPAGANFYPTDMSVEEFEQVNLPQGKSQYTMIRRDKNGKLYAIPYHEYFKKQIGKTTELLRRAASYAENKSMKEYLLARAAALESDDYFKSDIAWMNMKDNRLDFVVGPIETYEDELFGYKTAHTAYVLIKDLEWSKKLEKFVNFLPELQRELPVPEAYKTESPGTDSDLNVYDAVYYAGDCNAGGKTIAINLPNDENVQLEKGTRRLQLKNVIHAKFDKIMLPISDILIDDSQKQRVNFNSFFTNVMFHEVAHGLGIKNTINEKGTVRNALKEQQSHLEEQKADILGLYMVLQLLDRRELEGQKEDYMVTFLAGILRSVRFGHDAHGMANMITFNYFIEHGGIERNADGKYRVNFTKMEKAIKDLSKLILTLQGNGDYEGVKKLTAEKGKVSPELQEDLDKLKNEGIPDDIIFEQGINALGL